MATEVKLKRGWLTKDVNRASARVIEWQSKKSKGNIVAITRSAKSGKFGDDYNAHKNKKR